jgi:hypothetical protein
MLGYANAHHSWRARVHQRTSGLYFLSGASIFAWSAGRRDCHMSTLTDSGSSPLCARPAATCWRRQINPGWDGRTRCIDARVHPVPRPECSSARRRSRVTSRMVRPLPHHSTARTDKPLSSVIASRAAPAPSSCPGLLRPAHRARSTPQPPTPRAGVPDRHVVCATPLGHSTPTGVLPASPTADSSLDFSSLWIFTRPKTQTRR